MTEDDLRGLLRELKDDPIPADSLARVRLRVAQRREKKSVGTAWKWLVAAFAAAMGVAVVALMLRPDRTPVPKIAATPNRKVIAMPAIPPDAETPRRSKARRTVSRKKPDTHRPQPAFPQDGLVVRIETADPDVVILLIAD